MYKVPLHISFPHDIADGLTDLSKQSGRPHTKLIFEACRQYLNTGGVTQQQHQPKGKQEDAWTPLDFLLSSGTGIR